MIFPHLNASSPHSLLHQHPPQSQQPSPKPQASVFWAVFKCTIWHYWAATNPPKVFYHKRGCNFLAVAAATKWLDEFSSIKHLYASNGLQTSSVAVRDPAQPATKRKHRLQYSEPDNYISTRNLEDPGVWDWAMWKGLPAFSVTDKFQVLFPVNQLS